jgi:hypothetical protein
MVVAHIASVYDRFATQSDSVGVQVRNTPNQADRLVDLEVAEHACAHAMYVTLPVRLIAYLMGLPGSG